MSKKSEFKEKMNDAIEKLPKKKRSNAILKIAGGQLKIEPEFEDNKVVNITVFEEQTRGRRKGEVTLEVKDGEVKDINWGWRLDRNEEGVIQSVIYRLEGMAPVEKGMKRRKLPDDFLTEESESRWSGRFEGL